MQVAFPWLDVVVRVVSEPSQVSSHGSVIFDQIAKNSWINDNILKLTIPLANSYLWVFSSGKDSISSLGSYTSLTDTAGEFWTCLFASTSYYVREDVLRRRFCRVVARICPKSAVQSTQLADFLIVIFVTLECEPYFLFSVCFEVETKSRHLSVTLITCIESSSLDHDLKRWG